MIQVTVNADSLNNLLKNFDKQKWNCEVRKIACQVCYKLIENTPKEEK